MREFGDLVSLFVLYKNEEDVGEFRKTRHPRNVEFNGILKVCFSGARNSRFSEV
jgi:hypothetical protein